MTAPATGSDDSKVLAFLRDRYLGIDPRILGIFRIGFGLLLLADLARRASAATLFYSNDGIFPNHFSLFAPLATPFVSLLEDFSTPGEVKVAMALFAVVYAFYVVGWHTRVFQVLALVVFVGLDTRNLFVENAGSIVIATLAAWTMFLPLGERYSIDALVRSLGARRDRTAAGLDDRSGIEPPHVSIVSVAVLGIVLEVASIYFFNAAEKRGPTWRSGEAVHWVLWQNRIATHLAAWLRMHEPAWLSPLLARATIGVEGFAVVAALTPVWQRSARTISFVATTLLHLSIAALVTLGPFSYAMIALNFLLLPPAWLDRLSSVLRDRRLARVVVYDPTDAGLHLVARILARLDAFRRLRFVDVKDEANVPDGTPDATFAVREPDGTWSAGTRAIVAAARSLPLGPILSVVLGNAIGTSLLRRLLLRRRHVAAHFAIEPGVRFDDPGAPYELAPAPTPLRVQWAFATSAVRESLALVLLLAVVLEIGRVDRLHGGAFRFAPPKAFTDIIAYGRLLQGWSVFAPDAPTTDGTLVVDGVTSDGRHLDPFTGAAPDFDAPLHGPWYETQLVCDYFLAMSLERNLVYREELRRWIQSWAELEGRPRDRLVSYEVWWVSDDSPPPGQTTPTNIQRKLLLSGR